MPTSLDEWQKRLETHFAQLSVARSNSALPLFALEHGLDGDEIDEIKSRLRAGLVLTSRLESHWLLWVVYATELGYAYRGDEYWDSFEENTPRWRDRGNRNQLRLWFSRFQTNYHGVRPTGAWANCFPIIAWPITHAILPHYLQVQFAKALYELRYRLADVGFRSAEAVGELLAANAWAASSRFRELLQQKELVGRIALALLSKRDVEAESPIYPLTLQRIVSDLEQVRSAKEWLTETRRFVADRLKGAGHSHGGTALCPVAEDANGEDRVLTPPHLRPILLLRRSGPSTWSAIIDIPSFAGIVGLNPGFRDFLASTRCKIAGTGGSWLPNGWLLANARRRVLKSWPRMGVPLVEFEQPNEPLDHFLAWGTRLSAGAPWRCSIGSDSLAREVLGRIVRPGAKYIVLSEREIPVDNSLVLACDLDCEGISASMLSVPDILSFENISRLQQLGLRLARTVRIWPAGSCGRAWDGEGHSEWLTNEAPIFGIIHDHPVAAYSLRLNNGAESIIEPDSVGDPVFVRISPLPVGRHTLSIQIRRRSGDERTQSSQMAEGTVALVVREPEPWIPGTTSYSGLAISVD